MQWTSSEEISINQVAIVKNRESCDADPVNIARRERDVGHAVVGGGAPHLPHSFVLPVRGPSLPNRSRARMGVSILFGFGEAK